jgi:hypothetical protein
MRVITKFQTLVEFAVFEPTSAILVSEVSDSQPLMMVIVAFAFLKTIRSVTLMSPT